MFFEFEIFKTKEKNKVVTIPIRTNLSKDDIYKIVQNVNSEFVKLEDNDFVLQFRKEDEPSLDNYSSWLYNQERKLLETKI